MKGTIHFDFDISDSAVKELEEAAALLDAEARKMMDEDVYLLQSAWDSDSGIAFRERYLTFAAEIQKSGGDLLIQNEEIKEAARRYYIAEQEAKRIASENGE